MPQPDPKPLEAILLDELPPARRPQRPWKAWLLAITAFVGFLLCSGVGLWGLSALVNLGQNARERGSLVYHWESPEERLASISAATTAEDVGCSKAELRDLSRFFTRLMESIAADDHEAFREHVDLNQFARRASLHPWADERGFSRLGLEDQLSYDLEGPDVWSSSFSISHVVWGARRDEAVVVVATESAGAYGKRPILADDTVKKQLELGILFKPNPAWNGSDAFLYESSPNQEDDQAWSRSWRELQRKISGLADRARVERSEGYGRVRIQFHRGHAQEDAWARVVRSKRSRSGAESLIAVLAADSALWPRLKAGARLEVGSYYPQEVELAAE